MKDQDLLLATGIAAAIGIYFLSSKSATEKSEPKLIEPFDGFSLSTRRIPEAVDHNGMSMSVPREAFIQQNQQSASEAMSRATYQPAIPIRNISFPTRGFMKTSSANDPEGFRRVQGTQGMMENNRKIKLYDRLVYTTANNTTRATRNDPPGLRGSLAITPVAQSYKVSSAQPASLRPGALEAIAGSDNKTSKNLKAFMRSYGSTIIDSDPTQFNNKTGIFKSTAGYSTTKGTTPMMSMPNGGADLIYSMS